MVQMRFSQQNSRRTGAHPGIQRRRSDRLNTHSLSSAAFRAGGILISGPRVPLRSTLGFYEAFGVFPRCYLLKMPSNRLPE
jgi:hypothetical protein